MEENDVVYKIVDNGHAGIYWLTIQTILLEMGLSPEAFSLYCHIKQYIYLRKPLSKTVLAEECRMSIDRLNKAVSELVDEGLLEAELNEEINKNIELKKEKNNLKTTKE